VQNQRFASQRQQCWNLFGGRSKGERAPWHQHHPPIAFLPPADLLTRDERQLKVREFKTSGRAYGEMEVETSLQATSYVNAVWQAYGEWAAVEFNILIKTKTPKFQRLTTARNESDVGRLGDIVESVERAVDQSIFFPIESPLNCSTCPFRQPCRQWKPERKLVPQLELVRLNGHVACSPN
jgi:hypothetical protein